MPTHRALVTRQFWMIQCLPPRGPIVPICVFQPRRLPVLGRVHQVQAVHGDVAQAGLLGKEDALADIDLGQRVVGIGLAEVGADDRGLLPRLGHARRPLRWATSCGVCVSSSASPSRYTSPAVMPLAVLQPAAGEFQGVGVVVAEEIVRQFRLPDPATLVRPRRDALGALDEHLLARRGAVGDPLVFTRAAASGLDPFAIRAGVNDHGVAGLGNRRGLADRQVWIVLRRSSSRCRSWPRISLPRTSPPRSPAPIPPRAAPWGMRKTSSFSSFVAILIVLLLLLSFLIVIFILILLRSCLDGNPLRRRNRARKIMMKSKSRYSITSKSKSKIKKTSAAGPPRASYIALERSQRPGRDEMVGAVGDLLCRQLDPVDPVIVLVPCVRGACDAVGDDDEPRVALAIHGALLRPLSPVRPERPSSRGRSRPRRRFRSRRP